MSNHEDWVRADKESAWHPFTDHEQWCAPEYDPLILVKGEGVWLEDSLGERYIDANSSIWTNIHGHVHPCITKAIQDQATQVCHTSYLGFGNPRASELAKRLVDFFPQEGLSRVFFSDNGSTAIESALKMAIQYRQLKGQLEKQQFVAFHNAYHGDTMGASSLGGVATFFERFKSFGFPVQFVRSLQELKELDVDKLAGVVIEPLIQGVNQMHVWPSGMLAELRSWTERNDVHLILDEVMTGFGRTGKMFACQHENVIPDFLCLAKGLTAGYVPLAATLTKESIFEMFAGGTERTFYYGHSYTANQLGCAAALASLDVFEQEQTLRNVEQRSVQLEALLRKWEQAYPSISRTTQCGLVAGIQMTAKEGQSVGALGKQFCECLRQHGVLTRPILDTIVIMPPLCIAEGEMQTMAKAFEAVLAGI